MLEFSHEVNYVLQGLTLQTREIVDAIQFAAANVAARITEIKVARTAMAQASKLHETRLALTAGALPPSSSGAPPNTTAALDGTMSMTMMSSTSMVGGAGSSPLSTDATLRMLDDFQSTLRGLQRHALMLTNAHDTFLSTLQTDLKRRPAAGTTGGGNNSPGSGTVSGGRGGNAQGNPQNVMPLSRLVPFPGVLFSPNSTIGDRASILPNIFLPQNPGDGYGSSARAPHNQNYTCPPALSKRKLSPPASGLTTGCMSPTPTTTQLQPQPPPPISPRRTTAAPPGAQTARSTSNANGVSGVPASVDKAPVSFLRDKDGAGTIAMAFYFSFDALMRTLKAREGAAFVQRSPDECQGVCVFGPKPRHPSSVVVNLKSGVLGAVLKSGIALNVASEEAGGSSSSSKVTYAASTSSSSPHMLCIPIFESANRIQPIGALQVSRSEPSPFSEAEVAIAHQWTVCASQFLLGYGVDLVTEPFDPLQTVLRPGGPLSEFLRKKSASAAEKPSAGLTDQLLQRLSACSSAVTEGIASLLVDAQYDGRLASKIATQVPPQLVLASSHRNHSANFRPTDLKGQVELLRYQNVMDVAAYIQKLDDTWRRSADHLQGMELEQIHQMQDVKQGQRKLKTVSQQLDKANQNAREYREKYEVLKKELAAIASE